MTTLRHFQIAEVRGARRARGRYWAGHRPGRTRYRVLPRTGPLRRGLARPVVAAALRFVGNLLLTVWAVAALGLCAVVLAAWVLA
jgi:hypothetical protein